MTAHPCWVPNASEFEADRDHGGDGAGVQLFKFEAVITILADDKTRKFRTCGGRGRERSRALNSSFELLDLPEKQNAARSFVTFAASVTYMVGPSRLELLTSTVSRWRSNQLS
jgi:hypothetical protein